LNRTSGIVCFLTCLCVSASFAQQQQAQQQPQQQVPAPELSSFWNFPAIRFLENLLNTPKPETQTVKAAVDPNAGCPVAPLDAIDDPAAQQLEAAGVEGESTINIAGMSPAAAGALSLFQTKVAAAGGSVILKSAYRPAAYQQHLANVWYKWMTELRNNRLPACQNMKASVQEEFTRHRLIETQHPVAVSDHTRGLAFDATVSLPPRARIGRLRVTLDTLARLVGLVRPAIAADPVHFKFVGALARVRYAGSTRIARHTVRSSRTHRNA